MCEESVINAYQKILPNFSFAPPESFPEAFAQKRYLKKMEIPDASRKKERAAQCWTDWITFDSALPSHLVLPPSRWYQAREVIHKIISKFALADVDFSNGSEFTPTRGWESIQSKLSKSLWDCTRGNIDLFATTCYEHPALKKAVRERFKYLLRKLDTTEVEANRVMWKRFNALSKAERIRSIWRVKVSMVVNYVEGSRFSTVRKNNAKDRPINVEGFCNMVTQRRIGLGLKRLILEFFGVDLERGQDVHALLISLPSKATIDLSNASDSVTLALIRFLFPANFVRLLEQARSCMVLGSDGNFHVTKKISAMGNGFTFELMTLVLLALTRVHDKHSTVYGDDIIVENSVARSVISDLEAVGFRVNEEKSFIDSPFRESCGANYHDDHGYVESFDFEYPETIGDCVALHNKAYVLGRTYGSFRALYKALTRVVSDAALLGQWVLPAREGKHVPKYDLPPYFARASVKAGLSVKDKIIQESKSIFADYQLQVEPRFFWGWEMREETATKTLKHLSSRQWAKYYMYLHAGRRSKDVLRGRGRWQRVLLVTDGLFTTRWTSLRKAARPSEPAVVA